MSKEFNENNPGVSEFSYKYLLKNLQISRRKLIKILQNISEKQRIIITFNDNYITLKCDKLKELCDNWTQVKLQSNYKAKKKKLPQPIIDIDKELEEDIELDKRKTKKKNKEKDGKDIYTTQNFETFYKIYPKHVDRKEALKQWILLNKKSNVPLPDELNKIVQDQISCGVLNIADGRQYCMSPSKFVLIPCLF
ncbi:MAG TPA: hypothetical protein ENH82_06720 [bacterium]|nr:hypothetical protein [bacterium]